MAESVIEAVKAALIKEIRGSYGDTEIFVTSSAKATMVIDLSIELIEDNTITKSYDDWFEDDEQNVSKVFKVTTTPDLGVDYFMIEGFQTSLGTRWISESFKRVVPRAVEKYIWESA